MLTPRILGTPNGPLLVTSGVLTEWTSELIPPLGGGEHESWRRKLDLLRRGALLGVSSAGVHGGEQGEWRREERDSLMYCTTDTCGGEEVSRIEGIGLVEEEW